MGVQAVSGTALSGVDFEPLQTTITIPPSVSTYNVTVYITDDFVVEPNKTFYLTLNITDPAVSKGTTNITFHILNDDTRAVMGFQGDVVRFLNESVGSINVTIENTGSTKLPINVSVQAVSGTAVSGVDFEPLQTTINIPPSVSTYNVTVYITDDFVVEPNKTFYLTLNITDPAVSKGTTNITFHILNDDTRAVIGFQGDVVRFLNESVGSINVTIENTGSTKLPINVSVQAVSGTAVSGVDFEPLQTTINIPPSVSTYNVTVYITDDFVVEPNKTFYLTLNITGPAVSKGTTNITFHILNDDTRAVIGFQGDVVRFLNESVGSINVTIENTGSTKLPINVSVQAVSGTAVSGVDFEPLQTTINIPPSVSTYNVTVYITDDFVVEPNKTFYLTLNITGPAVSKGTTNITFHILNDDTRAVIGFQGDVVRFLNESVGSINVTIENTGSTKLPINVSVQAVSGTAVSGVDFEPLQTTINIPPSVSTYNVTVYITDDFVVEPNKTFYLTLNITGPAVSKGTTNITFHILNDDTRAVIGFQSDVVRFLNESVGSINVTIENTGSTKLPINVSVQAVSGTAVSGVDFQPLQTTINIPPSISTFDVMVHIIDDSRLEENKTFYLTISVTDPIISLKNANITINVLNDDTQADVGFKGSVLRSVREDAGLVNITVEKLTAYDTPVTVQVKAYNGTAYQGIDYMFSNETIRLGEGVRNYTFSVQIFDDEILENDKDFFLVLSSNDLIANLRQTYINLTIVNDDNATIGFTSSSVTVAENAGNLSLPLTVKSGILGIPIEITFAITNISASSSRDHRLHYSSVTFTQEEPSQHATVTIINDATLENTESFNITATTTSPHVTLNYSSVTVTITDHGDKVTFGFVNKTVSVTESEGNITLLVRKTGNTSIPLDLGISTVNLNASAPGDFTHKEIADTFAVNEDLKSYTFAIHDDHVTEGTECFIVRLNVSRANVLVDPRDATVCITDNDRVSISFVYLNITIEEQKGRVTVPMRKTGLAEVPVSVRLKEVQSMVWTAMIKADIRDFKDDIITFAPEQTEVSANITIVTDSIAESDELFSISFTPVDPTKAVVNTTRDTCVVRITDEYDNEEALKAKQQKEKEEKETSRILQIILIVCTVVLAVTLIAIIIAAVCLCRLGRTSRPL
ncbi:adhesion G-protein coupled receptor V1-like [Nematostella vectensis]|uniref:adhesion G-protein coupled receptor V1-like n=1 Tax=Nematostella vectensis TaxID=45351 RepID=UPI0020771DB5|nr:adhesion G-protein coupled receptor V1-like [Nematostella vectensis]